jgi:hypothetical protein
MPTWMPLLIAAITLLFTFWMNYLLKYAPTRAALLRDVRRSLFVLVYVGSNVLNIVMLLRAVVSPEPLTRYAVFVISLQVGTLMTSVPAVTIVLINDTIAGILRTLDKQNQILDMHTQLIPRR